jgi:hypothetical protein
LLELVGRHTLIRRRELQHTVSVSFGVREHRPASVL